MTAPVRALRSNGSVPARPVILQGLSSSRASLLDDILSIADKTLRWRLSLQMLASIGGLSILQVRASHGAVLGRSSNHTGKA